jgi:hypothetical protein
VSQLHQPVHLYVCTSVHLYICTPRAPDFFVISLCMYVKFLRSAQTCANLWYILVGLWKYPGQVEWIWSMCVSRAYLRAYTKDYRFTVLSSVFKMMVFHDG